MVEHISLKEPLITHWGKYMSVCTHLYTCCRIFVSVALPQAEGPRAGVELAQMNSHLKIKKVISTQRYKHKKADKAHWGGAPEQLAKDREQAEK